MPLDPLSSDLIPAVQAVAASPLWRDGRKPHPSTIWRWRKRGVAGIRLEAIRLHGQVWTTREAVDDFLARVAAAEASDPIPADHRTPRRRSSAAAAARKRLAEAGV